MKPVLGAEEGRISYVDCVPLAATGEYCGMEDGEEVVVAVGTVAGFLLFQSLSGDLLHKQKFIHVISPTPVSTMSTVDICAKPLNTNLSPYKVPAKLVPAEEAPKRAADIPTEEARRGVKNSKILSRD